MKGIYIFEDGESKGAVTCVTLGSIDHEFTQTFVSDKSAPIKVDIDLQAEVKGNKSNARCSKDDTYDFETGALIALIKMCRGDAVEKAFYEVYKSEIEKDEAEISAKENEYEERIRALEEKNNYLKEKLVERKKLLNALSGRATSAYEEKMKENAELKQQVEKLKEAYKTGLSAWEKELLEQWFSIYKQSKGQYKPLTRREQMWNDIRNGKITSVKVEKAFINDFLSEAEENGIVWANCGEKPTEWNRWDDWRRHDCIVFQIWNYLLRKELTWGITPNEDTVDYLPPMRWDLFVKGRMIVRVTADNVDDFLKECEKNCKFKVTEPWVDHIKYRLSKQPGFIMVAKDPITTAWRLRFSKTDDFIRARNKYPEDFAAKKIVDWEDVK